MWKEVVGGEVSCTIVADSGGSKESMCPLENQPCTHIQPWIRIWKVGFAANWPQLKTTQTDFKGYVQFMAQIIDILAWRSRGLT